MGKPKTIKLEDGRTVTINDKRRNIGDKDGQEDATKVQGYNQLGEPYEDKTVVLGEEPALDGPLAWLIEKKGERVGMTHRLKNNITSIGRDANNDISLSDESISAQHAKIRIEDGKFMLYDLVSENGTQVNSETIIYKEIQENDEVKIGETVLVFKKVG